jgi:hypothetical protein
MSAAGFNSKERAAKREQGPIVLGDVTYHARRLTNKRLREVRRISREAGRQAREAAKQTEEFQEALQEIRDRGTGANGEPLEGEALERYAQRVALAAGMESDEVDDINHNSLRKQLGLLLVDEGMQPPSEEALTRHLDEDLDTRDVPALMGMLIGADDEDPTPTAAS